MEEGGVLIDPADLELVGKFNFYFPDLPNRDDRDNSVDCYLVRKWHGEPIETDEMRPKWFSRREIPFHQMWVADRHWLMLVLGGQKVRVECVYEGDGINVKNCLVEPVDSFL